ncbi:hypothetical protein F0562_027473 [Nyssa sinensis]|uniref:Uncharacterized protein n=1 Tax=Nyssa sinensis TaxID=561372 RepID=A0A5J5B886_9ASTE|nr:hypothetical protein F0562_027473 [Nyssa sinensis]
MSITLLRVPQARAFCPAREAGIDPLNLNKSAMFRLGIPLNVLPDLEGVRTFSSDFYDGFVKTIFDDLARNESFINNVSRLNLLADNGDAPKFPSKLTLDVIPKDLVVGVLLTAVGPSGRPCNHEDKPSGLLPKAVSKQVYHVLHDLGLNNTSFDSPGNDEVTVGDLVRPLPIEGDSQCYP